MLSRTILNLFYPFAIFLTLVIFPKIAHGQSDDETEIINAAMQQAVAWNRHDAKAYAALFAEDCDVVNVPGWWRKGRRGTSKQS